MEIVANLPLLFVIHQQHFIQLCLTLGDILLRERSMTNVLSFPKARLFYFTTNKFLLTVCIFFGTSNNGTDKKCSNT